MRSKVFIVISLLCVGVVVADHWQIGIMVDNVNQTNSENTQQLAKIIHANSSLEYALKAEEMAFSAVKQLEEANDNLKMYKRIITEYKCTVRNYDKAMNDAGLNTQALVNENAKLQKALDSAEELLKILVKENKALRSKLDKTVLNPA
jgi:small-conductance mechanosensitive channel